jgi:hypothetical protein
MVQFSSDMLIWLEGTGRGRRKRERQVGGCAQQLSSGPHHARQSGPRRRRRASSTGTLQACLPSIPTLCSVLRPEKGQITSL